jgi:hypothetical protein
MVFIPVKVWLKRNLGQSDGGMGWGPVGIEEQAVEGNGPNWRPVVTQVCKGDAAFCQSEGEELWDGSDLTVVFHS